MSARRGALIGFGNVAEHGHLPGWLGRSDVKLIAMADPEPSRRKLAAQLLPGIETYASSAELLRRQRPDFVDIAAPPATHAALAREAAERGAHVLCEKPLALSVDDYLGVVRAARKSNVVLYTVHNWKQSEQFVRAQSLLAEGAVGRLRRIRLESIRSGQSVTVGQRWRTQAATAGGGILIDHGWHAFYLLTSLAGERPQRVSAVTERRRYVDADVEDTASCAIEFPTAKGEILLTWAGSERRNTWRLEGERGWLEVDGDRLTCCCGSETRAFSFSQSLSAGSHHPDWFAGVIDGFLREIDEPKARGQNLCEAEVCLLLTVFAYSSAARGGESLAIPQRLPC
jgi:predicted dehydrogenase